MKSSRRTAAFLPGSVLLLTLLGATAVDVRGQAPVKAGYTVLLEEVHTSRGGVRQVIALEAQALREDGATVLRLGPVAEAARHIRLPDGAYIQTNDKLRRMSSYRLPAQERIHRAPVDRCASRTNSDVEDGEEQIGTYRTVRRTSRGGAATRWYSLEHSCAVVQSRMEHSDGSTSDKRLVSLIPGAPDASFFDVSGYTEGPPSSLAGSATCDAACKARLARQDAEYHRRRVQLPWHEDHQGREWHEDYFLRSSSQEKT